MVESFKHTHAVTGEKYRVELRPGLVKLDGGSSPTGFTEKWIAYRLIEDGAADEVGRGTSAKFSRPSDAFADAKAAAMKYVDDLR